ncbi:DUF2470 domain-containing protein [Granulosicoccus antarcticus]|uniref:DUF2470 domain-containing protein n=1 Tax=Granulosicoccus antarcticus IMCC3135 TaxID=1192854 RepID=A0A2Z2P5S2_9GAMM|nr:DUF2470 domain-containing protein [Granulosicoccus antarcticus]ASJ75174.1 hypothetical protein IMCC3135_25560 [Granulosicoccus antarcticus IMCC3135]
MTENKLILDSKTVQSVVEHMNSDHADACLCIVRAFSEHIGAIDSQLIDLDSTGLLFHVSTHTDGKVQSSQSVRIDFTKPLREETQIRGALVGLTRMARQKLASLES